MIVTIMQPAYLAWPGFYDRIRRADTMVYLDTVDIDKNSKTKFTNRNRIRTKEGWSWLTIPLEKSDSRKINNLKIKQDSTWKDSHKKSIFLNYKKSIFFEKYWSHIESSYSPDCAYLVDALRSIDVAFLKFLGIERRSLYSSEMNTTCSGSDLILEICLNLGAKTYISGIFGRDYLDMRKFRDNGIDVVFHEYRTPEYPQVFEGFEPNLSVLDLLFNTGDRAVDYLQEGGRLVSS